jgi:crotonobetainyl-CoA:carnitine CoA-transferase CaiB-like acyl-CoA transferase
MNDANSRPLNGVRVLDFTSMLAGPCCARWLADLGADVIKVEAPEGDYMRSRPPLREGHSAYFGHLNGGKRSIVLDLKRPAAVALARRLAGTCDVVLEGSRPGVMKRLGLDAASLMAEFPRLVYCSVSGYGQEGPRAGSPAYAAIVHATSGFDDAWQKSQPAPQQPPTCGVQIADVVAATFATIGIQSALLARAGSGRGQLVDLSLAEGMMALMPLDLVQAQFPADQRRALYRPVRASDGYIVATPISQANFMDLCKAMGRLELQTDARYASPLARSDHWDELLAEIQAWAALRPGVDCVAALERCGVPAASYRSVAEAMADEQIRSRQFMGRVRDGAGEFDVANLPFRLNGAAVREGVAVVPALGQHTAQVLQELLGVPAGEVLQVMAEAGAG